MRYFQKLDPSSGFITSKGKLFKFPDMGNGVGGVETDHPNLINEFEMAMRRSVGGVSEISASDFETLKKNSQSPQEPRTPSITLDQLKSLSGASQPAAAASKNDRTLVNPRSADLTLPPEQNRTKTFRPGSTMR